MKSEFEAVLKVLKTRKVPGQDGILAELWKNCGVKIKEELFSIIKDCCENGTYRMILQKAKQYY